MEPTLAQSSGSTRPSPVDRRVEEMHRQSQQYERDSLKKPPGTAADPRQAQAIAAQVKQDFERIQVVYNEIVLAMSANKTLDYKFVSDSTTEIGKCARRLNANLVLPQPEEPHEHPTKPDDFNHEQMKPSLVAMLNHIVSFVTNPMFESSGVLDVNLSTRASRDLRKIIEYSDTIKESADKLNPASR
jgi:hypothetical protein